MTSKRYNEDMKKILPWGVALLVLVILAIGARIGYLTTNYRGVQVGGSSMTPTLKSGQAVAVTKKVGQLKRGDIVLFTAPPIMQCPPGAGCEFIKRVIAIPGDTIRIADQTVLLNGQKLAEPYLAAGTITNSARDGQFATEGTDIQLGPDQYFVMSDNREYGTDSRAWGTLEKKYILGVVQH